MKITIKSEVFQKLHPKFTAAFILATGIDNQAKAKEAGHLLREMERMVLMTFNKDTYKTHNLIAPWTVAREEFGNEAKHHHTSVEQLLKKVLNHKNVIAKDTATNLLRYLALKHIVPVSADDVKTVSGELTFALRKNDLYYRDAKKVLGTKLDYWKSAKTALNPGSKSALIHFEFLPPVSPAKQKEVVKETEELILAFCGGKVKSFLLNKQNNSVKI